MYVLYFLHFFTLLSNSFGNKIQVVRLNIPFIAQRISQSNKKYSTFFLQLLTLTSPGSDILSNNALSIMGVIICLSCQVSKI